MEIGEVIARGRKAAGLKQTELAAAVGLHVQTLKRLEGGAGAGYRTVRALQKALAEAGVTWMETAEGYEMQVFLPVRGRN
ncbi:MAG: helix-turn-helix transcriptional regulator, partial [Paracoccaceae bacterium]|jgi:transcriptional regulator with XRE-family HTH domain|nr:helix-turn-helix transcriptional regulator [Paracoccaceae bacterium]